MVKATFLINLLLVMFVSCMLPKYVAPTRIDPNFSNLGISTIGMLPVADLRTENSKEFKQSEYFRKWLKKNLEIRGYTSVFTGTTALSSKNVSKTELELFDPKLLPFLGEEQYRFVFLPVILEKSNQNYGVAHEIELYAMGIIYDKMQKKVLWINEASTNDTNLGPSTLLLNTLAVDEVIGKLMSGLPKAKQ